MKIAVCGQKGGTGKTTVAVAVASELIARGKKVLLVDADPQGSARTFVAIAGENGHAAPAAIAMGATMHLRGQLDLIVDKFDHVVIDCPPRFDDVQRSALAIAELAVLPCSPSALDGWAVGETKELLDQATKLMPRLRVVALITRRVVGTAIGERARGVLERAGLEVLDTELYNRVAYQEALAAGRGVAQYAGKTKPASIEVRALVDELTGGRRGKAHARRS